MKKIRLNTYTNVPNVTQLLNNRIRFFNCT